MLGAGRQGQSTARRALRDPTPRATVIWLVVTETQEWRMWPRSQRAWQSQGHNEGFFGLCKMASPRPSENPPVSSPAFRSQLGCFPAQGPGAEIILREPPFPHLLNGDSSRRLPRGIIWGNKQDGTECNVSSRSPAHNQCLLSRLLF